MMPLRVVIPLVLQIRRQRLAEFFKRRKAEKATGVKNPKNDVPESSPKAPSSTVGGLEIAKKNDYVLLEYVP